MCMYVYVLKANNFMHIAFVYIFFTREHAQPTPCMICYYYFPFKFGSISLMLMLYCLLPSFIMNEWMVFCRRNTRIRSSRKNLIWQCFQKLLERYDMKDVWWIIQLEKRKIQRAQLKIKSACINTLWERKNHERSFLIYWIDQKKK